MSRSHPSYTWIFQPHSTVNYIFHISDNKEAYSYVNMDLFYGDFELILTQIHTA